MLQQKSHLETVVFLLMEAPFKGRTLLLSFSSQLPFARSEETLTSGLWWVNVTLHLASQSQKCFLCCFLVNGICSLLWQSLFVDPSTLKYIFWSKNWFWCITVGATHNEHVSTCFSSFLDINKSYFHLQRLNGIIYLWWAVVTEWLWSVLDR